MVEKKKEAALVPLGSQKVLAHRTHGRPVSPSPRARLSLNAISFLRASHLQQPWLRYGIFHLCVTFRSWHPPHSQVFMPVNLPRAPAPHDLMRFPQEKYKLTNLFSHYPEDRHEVGEAFSSCCTCKPPHYSAPNKHLLRVNTSSSQLSVCRECPSVLGNLSLRKKK